MPARKQAPYKLAVDIGGTFTDVVSRDRAGTLRHAKLPTRASVADGVLAAIADVGAAPAEVDVFVHGTTIALNALLEGTTPPVGLVTTRGFRDVLEIMRTNRVRMYDLRQDKPVPLVTRRLRAEISARMTHQGRVLRDLDASELREIGRRFADAGVATVAVCLLHSYANTQHERETESVLREVLPGVSVSLSSNLTRECREFERASTTVINAATKPIMSRYLGELESRLADGGFEGRLLVMQSNGGVTGAGDARERPVASLMSGPAGAVAGASRLARSLDPPLDLVTLDIGGTSADVAVVERGEPTARTVGHAGAWPVMMPMIDIESIGAGGGSLARVDEFGTLSIGPDSAGAVPGPACYGRGGTRATVTDAHVVLGRIDSEQVLGGTVALDVDAARRAVVNDVAARYAMSVEEAAQGIVTVINSNMARLLWEMIVGRGRDPRDFALLALGGGGGLHACELATALGMHAVIVPPEPGVFSAFGMLNADTRHDFNQTIVLENPRDYSEAIASGFTALETLAYARFADERSGDEEVELRRLVELRYRGQRGGLSVEVPAASSAADLVEAARAAFEAEHQRLFGFKREGKPIDISQIQLSLVGHVPAAESLSPDSSRPAGARRSQRLVYLDGEYREAPVLRRANLAASFSSRGPCVIEELTGTTFVPPAWLVSLDHKRNLRLMPATSGRS